MAYRAVEVLCDRGPEQGSTRWAHGSGFLVGGRLVLTAAHLVLGGEVQVRRIPADDHPAKLTVPADVVLCGDPEVADLALLRLREDIGDIPAAQFARIDRSGPGRVVLGCWSVGFPEFMAQPDESGRSIRDTAQVNGAIPTAEGLYRGLLTLWVSSRPRPLPPRDEASGRSQWSGMSGAAVLAGEQVVGVVTEFRPPSGDSALTLTPITQVALDGHNAAAWCAALGFELEGLPRLPTPARAPSTLGSGTAEFRQWPSLLHHVRTGNCTPILGPGVTDRMLPTRQDIAARWAKDHEEFFPFGSPGRHDLAQVAQWLAVTQNRSFPRQLLLDEFRQALRQRAGVAATEADLDELVRTVSDAERRADPAEPHQLLAGLPFSLYLTTQPIGFMEHALVQVGRQPATGWCRWREDVRWPDHDPFTVDLDHQSGLLQPVVFHLLGSPYDPASLVVTEDDYIDYVIAVARTQHLIPPPVWGKLADSALMFLGFRMEDWDFRGLLRIILNQQGIQRGRTFTHVAVQIDPEASEQDSRTLKAYMRDYFRRTGRDLEISVIWGTVRQFLAELSRRTSAAGP